MSDTPETQEAVERWQQGKINIFDEMARLETERNRYKSDVEVITKERDEALEECAAMQKDAKDYIELADELDAVKRERDEAREENLEQANLLGMGGEREDRLIAERDELLKKLQRLANTLKQADEEYGPCIGGKADMLANAIEEATK